MHMCPRCLPSDPGFSAAAGVCHCCGEGLVVWPGAFQPEAVAMAEGGFARVFLAAHATGREGVLKLPRAAAEGRADLALRVLQREAEVLARLPRREGLPALLERVELNGALSGIVMSRIPGGPLSELLNRGLRPDVLLHVVRELCARLLAMRCAVGGAVSHLDLKPTNVLVSGDGPRPSVGLIDFGSALATGSERGITHAWASPELREASGGELPDPEAADVWSLGLLLYTGLCGRHPVDPDGPPPTDALPLPDLHRLPASLQEIAASCLATDAARRPRMCALHAALEGVVLPPPRSLKREINDPKRWRVSVRMVDGYSVLIVDDAVSDEAMDGEPFDAALLAEGLAPWLADPCAPDPDTRWTPLGWPERATPTVEWGRDLVCVLGLAPDCGALCLLRHRPTETVLPPDPDDPVALAWQRRVGAPDADAALDQLLASPEEDWEELTHIPLLDGRLVVLPGLLFHHWERGARSNTILRFSLSLLA